MAKAKEMPRIILPFRESGVQVSGVDNKNAALPQTFPNTRGMDIKNDVLNSPRVASTATDHDGLREQFVEAINGSIQDVEELIGQVKQDLLRAGASLPHWPVEVVKRPHSNKDEVIQLTLPETLNVCEHVNELATRMGEPVLNNAISQSQGTQ